MGESQSGVASKFRLINVLDYPNFFDQYEDITYDEILHKLDNSSLAELYQYFFEMVSNDVLFNCLEIIKKIFKQRNFDVDLPQPVVNSNPPAPLKK